MRFTPEYEACRRVSIEHRVPLADVQTAARQAFLASRPAGKSPPPSRVQ